MEQRTGKSKVLIDTCAWQYSRGRIHGLLLVALNGVDEDWANLYFAEHWPDWAGTPIIAHWEGRLRKKDEAALYAPAGANAFHVLCMNTEAFSTSARARAAAEKFLRHYPCMMAIDEATWIKDPSASRTKALIKLGRLAVTRRILSGTLGIESPFGVFAPFKFLSPDLLGFQSYYAFKAHFAELVPEHIARKITKYTGRGAPQLVAKGEDGRPKYKNLAELQSLMDPHSFRITRAQVGDMPQKLHTQRSVALTDEQQHFYDRVVDEVFIESEHGELTIANQLTRVLRLQQIVGGFMPSDEEGSGAALPSNRLDALMSEIELLRGGVVIWSRFRNELALIADALREAYGHAAVVEYHGGVTPEQRAAAKRAFRAETHDEFPEVRFLVANQAAGSYGNEFTVADDVIYYSNLFAAEKRVQSEDRVITKARGNRSIPFLDLISPGTVDEKIAAAVKSKRDVGEALLDSGGLTAWIKRNGK